MLSSSSELLRAQGELLFALRSWFFERGYSEVPTPAMVLSPALEENLEAIHIQQHNLWLHTSPEFALKKRLADGLCRIYQIAHCFREEEIGIHHRLEFRMLEWYRVGASWWDIANECIELIGFLYKKAEKHPPEFQWIQTTDFLPPTLSPEEWYFRWVDEVEPNLPAACIVYDYPAWQAALARTRHGLAERFEVFINGIELANAFDEEGSSLEVRKRWEMSNRTRTSADKVPYCIDEDFLKANDKMPRVSGIALGIDRLMMLLLDEPNIHRLM